MGCNCPNHVSGHDEPMVLRCILYFFRISAGSGNRSRMRPLPRPCHRPWWIHGFEVHIAFFRKPQPDPETAAGCGRYRDHVIGLEELIVLRCILLMFHGTVPECSRMFHSLSRRFTTQNWLGAPRRARVKMFSWPKHLKMDSAPSLAKKQSEFYFHLK